MKAIHTCLSILSERLKGNGFPYLRIRYEDLVGNPEGVTREILGFAEMPSDDLAYIQGKSIRIQASHIPLGNPGKFVGDEIEVHGDFQWSNKMVWYRRLLVRLISWPLLNRYSY